MPRHRDTDCIRKKMRTWLIMVLLVCVCRVCWVCHACRPSPFCSSMVAFEFHWCEPLSHRGGLHGKSNDVRCDSPRPASSRVRTSTPARASPRRWSTCVFLSIGEEFRVHACRCPAHCPHTSWPTFAPPHGEAVKARRLPTLWVWAGMSWTCAQTVSPATSKAWVSSRWPWSGWFQTYNSVRPWADTSWLCWVCKRVCEALPHGRHVSRLHLNGGLQHPCHRAQSFWRLLQHRSGRRGFTARTTHAQRRLGEIPNLFHIGVSIFLQLAATVRSRPMVRNSTSSTILLCCFWKASCWATYAPLVCKARRPARCDASPNTFLKQSGALRCWVFQDEAKVRQHALVVKTPAPPSQVCSWTCACVNTEACLARKCSMPLCIQSAGRTQILFWNHRGAWEALCRLWTSSLHPQAGRWREHLCDFRSPSRVALGASSAPRCRGYLLPLANQGRECLRRVASNGFVLMLWCRRLCSDWIRCKDNNMPCVLPRINSSETMTHQDWRRLRLQATASANTRSHERQSIVDIKGLGKPSLFKENAARFAEWLRKTTGFFIAAFGSAVRPMIESVEDQDITNNEREHQFGPLSDERDIPAGQEKWSELVRRYEK